MGWKFMVTGIVIVALFNSCCIPIIQKRFYTTEYGSDRPKRNRFKLAKQPYILQEEEPIETDCIYQSTFKMEMINKELAEEYTIFFRFFPNGRYLSGGLTKNENPLAQYNNLKKGIVGYYAIVGDKVVLEHFSVGSHDCGKYSVTELKIEDDGIGGYKKIKVAGLTGTPDW